jgi:hypothetical protein
MKLIDIDDQFEDYMKRCYPGLPRHAAQYRESRRIFFAGMATTFWHIMKLTGLPDDKAEAALQHLETQLREFAQRVGEDKDF